MADPEQIYSEVLSEEQGKGVTPAVAEGRAKAARVRAEHGSPHPKDPKWWPGAQPHLEGGNGAAPAEATDDEDAPAEEPAAEAAPAEAPAAEAAPAEAPAPAPEPAAAPEPAPAPAPAEAPAAAAAPAPAAAAAPAATATSVAPEQRPPGVTHGVPTGTRLRPEDAVQSEASFDAQQLVYERRRRIDEVISTGETGPPATGPRSGQWALFLVYLAIVGFAIFFVVENQPASGGAEGGTETEAPGGEGDGGEGGGGLTVTAAGVAFDTDLIELPAGEETSIEFVNDDASSVQHNIAIYEDDSASNSLFQGDVIPGGESITYEAPAIDEGTYYFQCDVHPGMNGDVEVK